MRPRPGIRFFVLTLALAGAPLAGPGDTGVGERRHPVWEDDDDSHDRARRANEGGEILDMSVILGRVRAQAPGRVLDTELEREHGRWIYEVKLLDPRGRLYELEVDARTGAVLHRGGSD
jgi:uncharacterized membrane protein YkoI